MGLLLKENELCHAEEGVGNMPLAVPTTKATAPVDSSLQGFVHVAFLRDLHVSPPHEKEQQTAKYLNINTHLEAKQYMNEVRQKVETHQVQ